MKANHGAAAGLDYPVKVAKCSQDAARLARCRILKPSAPDVLMAAAGAASASRVALFTAARGGLELMHSIPLMPG